VKAVLLKGKMAFFTFNPSGFHVRSLHDLIFRNPKAKSEHVVLFIFIVLNSFEP